MYVLRQRGERERKRERERARESERKREKFFGSGSLTP
jgi:hypothetical protein